MSNAKLTPEELALLSGENKVSEKSDSKSPARKRKDADADPIADVTAAVKDDEGKTIAPAATVGDEMDERTVDAKAQAKEQAEVDKLFNREEKKDVPEPGNTTPVQYEGDGWGDTPVQMRGDSKSK